MPKAYLKKFTTGCNLCGDENTRTLFLVPPSLFNESVKRSICSHCTKLFRALGWLIAGELVSGPKKGQYIDITA